MSGVWSTTRTVRRHAVAKVADIGVVGLEEVEGRVGVVHELPQAGMAHERAFGRRPEWLPAIACDYADGLIFIRTVLPCSVERTWTRSHTRFTSHMPWPPIWPIVGSSRPIRGSEI